MPRAEPINAEAYAHSTPIAPLRVGSALLGLPRLCSHRDEPLAQEVSEPVGQVLDNLRAVPHLPQV